MARELCMAVLIEKHTQRIWLTFATTYTFKKYSKAIVIRQRQRTIVPFGITKSIIGSSQTNVEATENPKYHLH